MTNPTGTAQRKVDVELKIAKIIDREGIKCDMYGREDPVPLQRPTAKKILNLLKRLRLLRKLPK